MSLDVWKSDLIDEKKRARPNRPCPHKGWFFDSNRILSWRLPAAAVDNFRLGSIAQLVSQLAEH